MSSGVSHAFSRGVRALLVLGVLALSALNAAAETYPSRIVRMVVPQSAGGVTDVIARAVAQRLSEVWGQQVVVENKPGANYQIGMAAVAKADPDGYTLLVTSEAYTINPLLYSNLSYDPVKDLAPITGLIVLNHAMVANPSLPVKGLPDLLALAKQKPGEINYATYGAASTGHLNMEMLQSATGAKFFPVHYKGAAPAFTDVLAGHVPLMFISVGTPMEAWQAGKVKILAVGSEQRLPRLPDVPTIAEADLPGFRAVTWFGLFTTGGAPKEIVNKVNADVQAIFADVAFREKYLAPQMFEPLVSSPEQFAAFLAAESQKWGKVIRDAKLKIEN
jgi:tripartite-type tricarboxylate transporter receptor subunit TctC